MKNSVQILTIALVLLTGTIGMRNLVVAAAPAPTPGTVLANGIADPAPPFNAIAANGIGDPAPPFNSAKNGIGDPAPPFNFAAQSVSWSGLADPAPSPQR